MEIFKTISNLGILIDNLRVILHLNTSMGDQILVAIHNVWFG